VAGPLEDLLAKHGAVVIERVEAKARQRSEFRDLLSMMYLTGMPAEIQQRITNLLS
jgi:hypothetical protein